MEISRRVALILSFLSLISVTGVVSSALHVVGGSQGWDESADFDSWASSQTFRVGDQLVFKYTSGLHSVVELGSETSYKKCDISNSINSMDGGSDTVKLNKAGSRYFACGTSGHCSQGMKLKVTVVAANASSSPSTAATSSSPSSTSPASYTSAAPLLRSCFAFLGCSVLLAIVAIFCVMV
ncbi:hypothetical protein Droror1_Dr00014013 [Drosera rotundifolia]